MTRKRCLEMLALAAAAAASFATSAPPPDWTQSDETPQQALSLRPGEETTLSIYAEGPPSFSVGLAFESDEQPPVEVTVTADGALERCGAFTLGLDSWSVRPLGEPPRYRTSFSVPPGCFADGADGGGLLVAFRALARTTGADDARPVTLYVTVSAGASGDDDERQVPPARVELR